MKRAFRYILVWLAVLAGPSLYAQCSGGLDASGGFDYMPQREKDLDMPLYRYFGKGTVRVGYRSPKFTWTGSLGGNYDYRDTDTYRASVSGSNLNLETIGDVKKGDFTIKGGTTQGIGVDFKNDFHWQPTPSLAFDAWIRYQYKDDKGNTTTVRIQGETGGQEKEDVLSHIGLYMENPFSTEHGVQAGTRVRHQLAGPRRVLNGEVSIDNKYLSRYNTWLLYEADSQREKAKRIYRITPYTGNQGFKASIHYMDSVLRTGPVRLVIDPGLRLALDNTRDRNSGAVLEDIDKEIWRDSTRLRENFNYLTLRAEPYFAADLSWSKLRAHIDYSPQLYFRRLTDEVHTQNLNFVRPYPVGSGWLSWTFSPQHKLTFRNNLSVNHPSYIQICWYERHGNYLTQIFRGKEDLKSTHTFALGLEYEFKYKRFLSTTKLSYSSRMDEVDQTYTREVIEDRNYQVFTWVNASDSHIYGATEILGWRGRKLTANVGVTYNANERKNRESGQFKRSFDWRVWADATLSLPKDWKISADMNYRSNVATFFTIFKQYCALNVKVEKKIGKVTLSLNGRDLLDNETEKSYLSADQTEMGAEVTRLNRRVVILGVNWNF